MIAFEIDFRLSSLNNVLRKVSLEGIQSCKKDTWNKLISFVNLLNLPNIIFCWKMNSIIKKNTKD